MFFSQLLFPFQDFFLGGGDYKYNTAHTNEWSLWKDLESCKENNKNDL